MIISEQLGTLVEKAQSLDMTDAALSATLVVTALVGLVRSYRALDREDFDDSIFIDQK